LPVAEEVIALAPAQVHELREREALDLLVPLRERLAADGLRVDRVDLVLDAVVARVIERIDRERVEGRAARPRRLLRVRREERRGDDRRRQDRRGPDRAHHRVIPPQASRPPALPVGSVVSSSAFSCTTRQVPPGWKSDALPSPSVTSFASTSTCAV